MTRHVLSLSGGKDSAALAVYLRDRVPEMEYIFHDTGKELPETYDYMARLESILGRPVTRTTPDDPFEHWLAVYGDMLPSNHRRWCTKMLKLKPFETYIGDDPTINYVGLRADEKRTGYISTKPNITAVYPFQEDGLVRADVIRILEDSGLGLPPYMEWGRSRSGCYFCFYQQKIEWVRLKRKHPEYFELAKGYEVRSALVSKDFTWCSGESLAELEQPERMEQIERNWEVAAARRAAKRENLPLSVVIGGIEVEEEEPEGCLICSL
ncbi:phosphoadenosine phosphosulfate reductase family protein [Gluconacetobacter diazotrophicus]|uniref:phosphoadenosine phosphosulfate reductase family protein n=1 Tax=Gluconacetobacter diazotrophicus TaxID=33996 RepID=UPI001199CDD3|nr:phosphoadenosine phosphosulfate reductase family protein [Gluconacetobacter diazotrophicus]TWB02480.1 3'-phosphoadenosine 5'-phosphosulfate sulfotransferase (PAPS reductase)/FAD synthetase [Gluconacetobacter diazotrophicus]